MIFECMKKTGRKIETWKGNIIDFKSHGSHYEIRIESRSGITVLYGNTSQGEFACMPEFGAGCYLTNPADIFWNTERLSRVLGKVDGITVATALYELGKKKKI